MPNHDVRVTFFQMRDAANEALAMIQSRWRADLDEIACLTLRLCVYWKCWEKRPTVLLETIKPAIPLSRYGSLGLN